MDYEKVWTISLLPEIMKRLVIHNLMMKVRRPLKNLDQWNSGVPLQDGKMAQPRKQVVKFDSFNDDDFCISRNDHHENWGRISSRPGLFSTNSTYVQRTQKRFGRVLGKRWRRNRIITKSSVFFFFCSSFDVQYLFDMLDNKYRVEEFFSIRIKLRKR